MPFAISCLITGPPIIAGVPLVSPLGQLPIGFAPGGLGLFLALLLSALMLRVVAEPRRARRPRLRGINGRGLGSGRTPLRSPRPLNRRPHEYGRVVPLRCR